MLFEQISDFEPRLKTKISENIFSVLPEDGIFMVVFDSAGRTISSDKAVSETIFNKKSIFKKIIHMLGDGCGSITSTIAGQQMLAFDLARWQDTQLYAIVVFRNLSAEAAPVIEDIFELMMNQFVSLANHHIENPQHKAPCIPNNAARFVYN
jgi:hypothetical protein